MKKSVTVLSFARRAWIKPAGQEHIHEQEDGKKRWVQVVTEWEMSNDEFGMAN